MMFNITKKIIYFTLSSALVLTTSIGRADDTEIYFNTGDATNNTDILRPNILFILDTSGSMTLNTSTGVSRLNAMKDAVKTVLGSLENANVGLMRFHRGGQGGPVIFPIKDLDGNVNDVVGDIGQNTVTEIVNTAFIQSNTDDGEEVTTTNNVSLTDPTLDAFDFGGTASIVGGTQTFTIQNGNDDGTEHVGSLCPFLPSPTMLINFADAFIHPCRMLGLRFAGVTVPQGSTIKDAFIDLRSAQSNSDTTEVFIVGQNIGNASPLASFGNDISSREPTPDAVNVEWDFPPFTSNNQKKTSPNIKTIVQEIVNRADWSTGNAMFFRLQHENGSALGGMQGANNAAFRRIRTSEHGNSSRHPKLRIETESSGAEVPGDPQMIALRFTDLRIPQGATLTEAKLSVTTSATNTGTAEESTWRITAEQVDDSLPLEDSVANITSRDNSGPSVNWTIDASTLVTVDEAESSVDIKSAIQSVVNRPGWCGGNSLTLLLDSASVSPNKTRFLHSHDSDSSQAPRLTYKHGVGATGCVKALESSQTALTGDDAEESSGAVNVIDNDLDLGFDADSAQDQTVGLRFQGVSIPKDATIISAKIIFTAKGASTSPANFIIKGIDNDNLTQFTNSPNDISSRTTTSAAVSWNADPWITSGVAQPTIDISTIVQEIVNRGGWVNGNAMGFTIEGTSGADIRTAETVDGDVTKSPRLLVEYQTILETPFKTNRQRLIELVDGLPAEGGTPIAGSMLEAAKYWRGDNVFFGKSRQNQRRNRLSHAATYCDAAGSCNGGTIDGSTDDFAVTQPGGCSTAQAVANPDKNQCKNRQIKGNPNYISPFNSVVECATNHQVLLTDGSANGSSGTVRSAIQSIAGSGCFSNNSTFKRASDNSKGYGNDEKCVVDLAKALHEEDQSSAITNKQIVKTHTIGFNLTDPNPTQFITDIAHLGGGDVYSATTASDLVTVFENILTQVKNDPTSFVAPALATNQFNKLISRNEAYFGLFTPSLARAWDGNIKKYEVCVDSSTGCNVGDIVDANNNNAIDTTTSKFKDTAQSIWSSLVDGLNVTKGGAGAEITDFTTQKIYTDKNNVGFAANNQSLDLAGFKMDSSNWNNSDFSAMRTLVCPSPSTANGSDCEKRMLYLLGKKHLGNPETDVNPNQRWSVHDVLHSQPVVLTYEGIDTDGDQLKDKFIDKVIYGTNDGVLHMVDGETGQEDWRYMPSDFWGQQQNIFTNAQGAHLYGLDLTPTIQIIDKNNDGLIRFTDDDKARAFLASRRGGNNIYALELSDITANLVIPRFLWRIQGGTGDFARLGQTWSKPKLIDIAINDGSTTQIKEVLVFGGGYDPVLDNRTIYFPDDNGGNDFMGNAIYIVDPDNGNKLLSISGSGSGADIIVPDMGFSIPSEITTVDSDADGVVDRLVVGDTGGQIWRVDLAPLEISLSDPESTTVVGKLADISGTAAAERRRFFEPASYLQQNDSVFSNTPTYDYILIGTGYRPHPLDKDVEDRFYAIRDFQPNAGSINDTNDNNIADTTEGYPQASGEAFSNSDLINITTTPLDASLDSNRASAGWFFDFTQAGSTGRKVYSKPITAKGPSGEGSVTFTSFAPEASPSDPCGASVGNSKAHNFNVTSAGAAYDYNGDGSINLSDRSVDLGAGIASGVVPLFTNEGVIGIVGVEGGSKNIGKIADLTSDRAYWLENVEF